MPDRNDRQSRTPEMGTPWWPESEVAQPAQPARKSTLQSRRAEPASTGRLGHALSRLPEVWLWVMAGLSLLVATATASLAHSLLLLPLVPMAVLLAITAVVRLLLSMLLSEDTESEVPGIVVGLSALLFGWAFGAWMLWMIPASVVLLSTKPDVGVALVIAAALGSLTLPGLAVALGLRSEVPGSGAWLPVRLGATAGIASVVGAAIFGLLVPSG